MMMDNDVNQTSVEMKRSGEKVQNDDETSSNHHQKLVPA